MDNQQVIGLKVELNRMSKTARDNNDIRLILLLMQNTDAEFFAKVLKPHAPDTHLVHLDGLENIEKYLYLPEQTRLISFCSPHIVPGSVLKRLNFNCFNFHPGPPERPGYQPVFFAIDEGDTQYGMTFHVMHEKVDTGPIIDADYFPIEKGMSVEEIETETYKIMLMSVVKHAALLADVAHRFKPSGHKWSGKKVTKKDVERLREKRVREKGEIHGT